MDEIWERAVETALDGERNCSSVRNLTLDGAVKCVQGKLPPPSIFDKFQNLEHLSIANIGVSSLEQFPRLRNLQKLILSDNRIAGGLEFLVSAGLNSLRDLDLSNNRIQDIEDLRPLAELRLISLDLYECPVTRVKDYRSRVFGLIRSLKYLDKMDSEGNDRPESDDEEEEDEDEDDDDPGSGEVDGEQSDQPYRMSNGHSEGVVDVDEDESDADEEETEIINGSKPVRSGGHSNGFRIEPVGNAEDDEDDDEDDDDFVEEIDEEGDDDDVVEVHDVEDTDEEDVEDDDEDDDDDDGDDVEDDEEEVDNDEGDFPEPESTTGRLSTEGEIDGHEQGEEDADEDDDGETGEEEDQGIEEEGDFEDEEEAEDEEEDNGTGYLVQPVGGPVEVDAEGSDVEPVNGNEDHDVEEDEEDDYGEVQELPPSSSSHKRKRDGDDDDGEEDDDKNDEYAKSSKHR